MTKQNVKLIAAAGIPVILFCVHIVNTVLYNLPENPVTKEYMPAVNRYMEPLFSQNWHLFAPEPATRMVKLWYRVKMNNEWQHWQDPMEPVLVKHRHNRATYNAKLLYIYGNIAKDLLLRESFILEQTVDIKDSARRLMQQHISLKESSEYQLALRFVGRDIEKGFASKANPDSLQLMLVELYPRQFSERNSSRPFSFAQSVEIPPDKFMPNSTAR